MINKKYYPFTRNHYFYGKLLSVRDFEDEQKYMNDKRRMHTHLTAGAGVVGGLSVVVLNDKTISVEAGMAIDYLGREIVIDESVTKKLSVIDGFEKITDLSNVYLCLEYKEEQHEEVHSIIGNVDTAEKQSEYNRIRENYRLFLKDQVSGESMLTAHFLIQDKQVVYEGNGIRITHIFPRFSKAGEYIKFQVCIEKYNLPCALEVNYECTLTNLKTADHGSTLHVHSRDESIDGYGKQILSYVLLADEVKETMGTLAVLPATFSIIADTAIYSLEKPAIANVWISILSVHEQIMHSHMKQHFDEMMTKCVGNTIYLAKFRLLKQDMNYAIEQFEPLPFRQYLLSNAMLAMLLENAVEQGVLANEARNGIAEGVSATLPVRTFEQREQKRIMTGEAVIEVDRHAKNKAYYSEELAHGMGPGDVLLSVEVKDFCDDSQLSVKKSVFGDVSVFDDTCYEPMISGYTTGILSYPDRGTFRIGIRFQRNVNVAAVKVQWWADKRDGRQTDSIDEAGKVEVRVEPNIVRIMPQQKYRFEVMVYGTNHKGCRWYCVENVGGEIDENGVYHAPSQEGVYEVIAESIRYPGKKASAFIVVRKEV